MKWILQNVVPLPKHSWETCCFLFFATRVLKISPLKSAFFYNINEGNLIIGSLITVLYNWNVLKQLLYSFDVIALRSIKNSNGCDLIILSRWDGMKWERKWSLQVFFLIITINLFMLINYTSNPPSCVISMVRIFIIIFFKLKNISMYVVAWLLS